MSEEKNFNTNENEDRNEKYSLNDDRRIKTLSPGQLVMKRFLRNKVAVAGMIILVIMFLFSFVGGWLSPYGQEPWSQYCTESSWSSRNPSFSRFSEPMQKPGITAINMSSGQGSLSQRIAANCKQNNLTFRIMPSYF